MANYKLQASHYKLELGKHIRKLKEIHRDPPRRVRIINSSIEFSDQIREGDSPRERSKLRSLLPKKLVAHSTLFLLSIRTAICVIRRYFP